MSEGSSDTRWYCVGSGPSIQDVLPVGDTVDHDFGAKCECGPVKESVMDGPHVKVILFIHIAYDGRSTGNAYGRSS